MKVFVKYSPIWPYLPVAVADSYRELAEMIGVTEHSVRCSFWKKYKTFAIIEIEEDEQDEEVQVL